MDGKRWTGFLVGTLIGKVGFLVGWRGTMVGLVGALVGLRGTMVGLVGTAVGLGSPVIGRTGGLMGIVGIAIPGESSIGGGLITSGLIARARIEVSFATAPLKKRKATVIVR